MKIGKSSANRRDAEAQRMEINQITEKIIGAAIEIHKILVSGLLRFGLLINFNIPYFKGWNQSYCK